ncbi:MAG: hypothetical protein HYY04_06160 [Chloroflexi bacterium]|nr:hypothetical protein [Chloroflexota bacterium]
MSLTGIRRSTEDSVRGSQNLNGEWSFELDAERAGEQAGWPGALRPRTIRVPGSWQEQGFGDVDPHMELRSLLWRRRYHGMAWYAREIPVDPAWAGSRIVLELDRVNWLTRCWVNGTFVGEGESIATPQRFDLSAAIRPGETNLVALSVDSWRPDLINYHEWQRNFATSGNPGGLLGPARLLRLPRAHVERVAIQPRLAERVARCQIHLQGAEHLPTSARVVCRARAWTDESLGAGPTVVAENRGDFWQADVPVVAPLRPWSPADPFLYLLEVEIVGRDGAPLDQLRERFGMREVCIDGLMVLLNGQPIFQRFDVDFMIFPNQGYPPADREPYVARFRKYREYGFNGTRCHSWVPPRAYFDVADEEGLLIQCELPNWSNMLDTVYVEKAGPFLAREWERIIGEFQPHPSLIVHCVGNELLPADAEGRYGVHSPWINERIRRGRQLDPTRLYVDNSGFVRVPPEAECLGDLLVPSLITGASPDTRGTFFHYIRGADRPVIAHEHTLTTSYPNLDDEPLYEGHLIPTGLRRTREALAARRMLDQWPEFLRAAGHQQVIYMKELFEKVRRTPGMAGWHMNSFEDNNGRSWAQIGYVDGFFRDKGFTTAEEVRRFADDTVVLMAAPERNYFAGETFTAELLVSHFGVADADAVVVRWSLSGTAGVVAQGELPPRRLPNGHVTVVGGLETRLPRVARPQKLTLEAACEVHGRATQNRWDFWVFPPVILRRTDRPVACSRRLPTVLAQYPFMPVYDVRERRARSWDPYRLYDGEVAITDGLVVPHDIDFLLNGGSVLALVGPDHLHEPILSRFMPPWCSWIFFPTADFALTGAVVRQHPLMDRFPHEGCLDWQFYHLVEGGTLACLDALPAELPVVVQAVDAPQRSKRLAYLFEARVGRGKLLFTTFRLADGLFDGAKRREIGAPNLQVDPAAAYLLDQMVRYVQSDEFAPSSELAPVHLLSLCKRPASERLFH